MKQYNQNAVSPVVGVMLMLVITIIIAAVVSGFGGGLLKGQTKAPQGAITGTFSVTQGLTITDTGGDPIPTDRMLITTYDGPTFGQGTDTTTVNPLNLWMVTNAAGTPVENYTLTSGSTFGVNVNGPTATVRTDAFNIKSFNPGDTWYVNLSLCNAAYLQPTIYGTGTRHGTQTFVNGQWTNTLSTDPFWQLELVNPANIGKTFYIDINDKNTGALIAHTPVTITG
jgi:FlaG/FlaF family flagellin (archaellin)